MAHLSHNGSHGARRGLTLERLRANRNLLFWTLHAAGWSAYAITQFFGALLAEKPQNYQIVIALASLSGFVLTMPLRYIYRRLWGRSPLAILTGVFASCYIVALAFRAVINVAYREFVSTDWQFKTMYEVFGGALSATYLILCWSALYFGFKYWESLQQQREAMLRAAALAQEAQLKMLRYQLNPHFLFNTLNAISTLILDNQNRIANHAVTRLAEFLRYTLDQDPMKKVTLGQELEALELYLNTERLRFGSRLRLEYAIEEPALSALVPSLLLQPLIENAVKYAISPREDGGCIRIEGRTRGAVLEISVLDDGPGLSDTNTLIEGRGVGLRNTRERLAVLYGEHHRFVALNSRPGLRIEMAFPLEREPPSSTDSSRKTVRPVVNTV
jgi:two-component system, LytTR family, sensor kinase